MDEEESCRVLESILAYQDLELLGIALKYTRNIPTELLQVPEDERENRFMRELLNLYVKYIDIQDDTKRLWRISLCCGAEVMAERLLKKTEDYQYLPQIAEGREEVFDLLLGVPARKVLDEVKKEVLYSALVSEHWKERLETLEQKGWTKSSRQRKGKIQFVDESIRRLEKKKYASDRRGKLEQVRIRQESDL